MTLSNLLEIVTDSGRTGQPILADWNSLFAQRACILLHDPRLNALGVKDMLDVTRHLAHH